MCVCVHIYILIVPKWIPMFDAFTPVRCSPIEASGSAWTYTKTPGCDGCESRTSEKNASSMVLWTTSIRFIWHNRKATLCFKFITKMKLAIWITWDSLWSTISCTEWQLRNYKEQTGTDSQQILTKWKAQPLEHQKQHISQCFLVSLICKHKQNMH